MAYETFYGVERYSRKFFYVPYPNNILIQGRVPEAFTVLNYDCPRDAKTYLNRVALACAGERRNKYGPYGMSQVLGGPGARSCITMLTNDADTADVVHLQAIQTEMNYRLNQIRRVPRRVLISELPMELGDWGA